MNRAQQHVVEGLTYWTVGDSVAADASRSNTVHLLPVYDEYLVAYRDREAVPHAAASIPASSGGLSFLHALVVGGQVAGTWRTTRRAGKLSVDVIAMKRLTPAARRGVAEVMERYQRFLDAEVSLSIR